MTRGSDIICNIFCTAYDPDQTLNKSTYYVDGPHFPFKSQFPNFVGNFGIRG